MMAKPTVHAVAAVLTAPDGKILIAQRPSSKNLPGQWELPGGKPEANETEALTLVRELREELSLVLAPGELSKLPVVIDYEFPNFFVHIPLYTAQVSPDAVFGAEGQALAWVSPHELAGWDILPGIRHILPQLMTHFSVRV
jgi:8-oxo-dGTP diphosphatase